MTYSPDSFGGGGGDSFAPGGGIGDLKLTAVPLAGSGIVEVQDGWLWCNGAEVGRAAYAALYDAIGTHYGPGDGALTFNLPDWRGRVFVAASPGGKAGVDFAGESDGLLPDDRNVSHVHEYTGYIGGLSGPTAGAPKDPTTLNTSGDSDNLNAPAWQVGGGVLIRAT